MLLSRRAMLCLLVMLLLAGCGQEPRNLVPTLDLNATALPAGTAGPRTTARPCLVEPASPTLPQHSDFTQYPAAIETYLNEGGTPDALAATLREYGLFDENFGGVTLADFSGNGLSDMIVTLLDPALYANIPPGGIMLLYGCIEDQYQHLDTLQRDPAELRSVPVMLYAGDMNNDGRAELVYDERVCGAHTCVSSITIANWNAETAALQLLNAAPIEWPQGSHEIYDVGQDGIDDLIIYAGAVGSAGAGPQRAQTITYSWDGTAFIEASRAQGPPQYRIHVIHDAIAALGEDSLDTAAALFGQGIGDASLREFGIPDERQRLNAFAAYGLLLVRAREGGYNAGMAAAAYEALQGIVPAGSPGSEWIRFGALFWNTYQSGQDIHAACEAVTNAITQDGTNPRSMFDFGYANPIPAVSELCPF